MPFLRAKLYKFSCLQKIILLLEECAEWVSAEKERDFRFSKF